MLLLHFVSLENNKMFLHISQSTTWTDILGECMLYTYCQEHLPQQVVFGMPFQSEQEVDEILLLFQTLFGEEDICRGVISNCNDKLVILMGEEGSIIPDAPNAVK